MTLPFPEEHFASVVALGVLEHVQFPERSLVELHRVLRPGGRLFICELPNRLSYLDSAARRNGHYYHGASAFDQVYDRRTATELVTCAGFRVDRCARANMLPLTHDRGLALRFAGAVSGGRAARLHECPRSTGWRPISRLTPPRSSAHATVARCAARFVCERSLLWTRACRVPVLGWLPLHSRALSDLHDALLEIGVEPASVVVRKIRTDHDAAADRFVGSPTIRINGVDVQPPENEPTGLTCRVYRRRDGRVSPTPDPADLRDALGAASALELAV